MTEVVIFSVIELNIKEKIMGWAKYHEDIVDAITDSGFYDRVSNYVTKSIEPPIFNCAYCNLSFYSKNDLYEHIKREHNIVSSILDVCAVCA